MAERTLRTRISLLVKSYAEWQAIKDTFKPLKGEVCIVNVPAGTSSVVNEPAVLFKVGDGTHFFSELSYSSALAADIYAWAKKENLAWSDMNEAYKIDLTNYLLGVLPLGNTQYRIVSDGDYKWKLQKSEDAGATWVDASGNIDVSALAAEIAKKVDKQVVGANGTALIFNESDGGGAQFVHTDGTKTFVGVNEGGESGINVQIYAVKPVDGVNIGSRLNAYQDKFYYINKANNIEGYASNDPQMEIAIQKDLSSKLDEADYLILDCNQ